MFSSTENKIGFIKLLKRVIGKGTTVKDLEKKTYHSFIRKIVTNSNDMDFKFVCCKTPTSLF